MLKQRVELQEKECSALAERLVKGQVDRAEGEEETYALEKEVQALRRANMDAQQRLAVAQDEIRSLEMTIAEVKQNIISRIITKEIKKYRGSIDTSLKTFFT